MKLASYVGTRPGLQGLFNKLVRAILAAPESHSELVFTDGLAFSCSFLDKGPRFKYISFDSGKWEFTELPSYYNEQVIRLRAERICEGEHGKPPKYSLLLLAGQLLPFLLRFVSDKDEVCSTAIAKALDIPGHKRYDPHELRILFEATYRG